MQNMKKVFWAVALLLATAPVTWPLRAQVNIGSGNPPQAFSVLELTATSSNLGGVRLPQMETAERDVITTDEFKANPLAKGLMIFNTTTNCVDIWNGYEWIEFSGNTLRAAKYPLLALPAIPSVELKAVKQTNSLELSIAYSDKTKEDIVLTDGQILGGSDGLSVVVNGNQTLSSVNGVIHVKLTGTPSATSKITIPIRIEGAAGSMEINIVNPNNSI